MSFRCRLTAREVFSSCFKQRWRYITKSNPFKSSFPESKLCGAFKTMFTLFGGTGMTNSEKEQVLRQ